MKTHTHPHKKEIKKKKTTVGKYSSFILLLSPNINTYRCISIIPWSCSETLTMNFTRSYSPSQVLAICSPFLSLFLDDTSTFSG